MTLGHGRQVARLRESAPTSPRRRSDRRWAEHRHSVGGARVRCAAGPADRARRPAWGPAGARSGASTLGRRTRARPQWVNPMPRRLGEAAVQATDLSQLAAQADLAARDGGLAAPAGRRTTTPAPRRWPGPRPARPPAPRRRPWRTRRAPGSAGRPGGRSTASSRASRPVSSPWADRRGWASVDAGDQRLDLDQQRAVPLERRGDDGAGDAGATVAEEHAGRVRARARARRRPWRTARAPRWSRSGASGRAAAAARGGGRPRRTAPCRPRAPAPAVRRAGPPW